MKAGIYKTPNGNLIYVAKDRTIKATTLKPSTWPGMKVSQKGSTVVFLGYQCDHVSDVPNGCTDHQGWLDAWSPGYFAKALRFSPSAAQFLAQSDNAARAQGEMVHKLVAEGYVEVPGTDELVHPGVDVSVTFTEEHSRLARSLNEPAYAVGGVTGLKPSEVPVALTQGREMSIEDCMGMRPSEIGNGPKLADSFVNLLNVEVSDKPQHEYIGNVPNLIVTSGDADPIKPDARDRRCFVVDAWADPLYEPLKRRGWRFCHGRSARKHRKRGDTVMPFSGGLFAWKRVAWRWHGTQTGSTRLFDAPENLPRHEEVADYRVRPAPNWPFVRNMTYVGPIEHLTGKTALVKKTHSPGNVLAQFDDQYASLTGEPVHHSEGQPPTFALGYSWHSFAAADFRP